MTATTMTQADRLRALTGEQLQRDGWSRDELLAYQQRRVRELIAHAVEHSAYYREALGPGELASQPTLSKQTLMDEWDRIVCEPRLRRAEVEAHAAGPRAAEPYLGRYQVFSTSGASGLRGLFAYGGDDWASAVATSMRCLARSSARPDERLVGIGAPPGVHMSQRVYAAIGSSGAGTPQLSALTPLDEMVAALNAFEPDIVLGYPTVAVLLAAEQLAGRLRIAPRMIALGSEPLTSEMRDRIQASMAARRTR